MLTGLPPSDHVSEGIHKQANIDEASFESDISHIANPDLITSKDVKVLKSVDPGTHTINGVRGLTTTDRLFAFINRTTADTQRCIPYVIATV